MIVKEVTDTKGGRILANRHMKTPGALITFTFNEMV